MTRLKAPGGVWIIRYPTEKFNSRDILSAVLKIDNWLRLSGIRFEKVRIHFDPEQPGNRYHEDSPSVNFILKDVSAASLEQGFVQWEENPGLFSAHPFKKILLAAPFRRTDPRWESILLTSAALFLGSALSAEGLSVDFKKIPLPSESSLFQNLRYDMIGFTLFEDLLPEIGELISKIRHTFSGLLAGGGPLATLNPLEAAYHLPELNLLVRGEGELILPGLLKTLEARNPEGLFQYSGLLYREPGYIIMSHLDKTNRPENLEGFSIAARFPENHYLKEGLEINLSRGCRRGCTFCSAVQGKKLRKLPVQHFRKLLALTNDKLQTLQQVSLRSRTLNINDDDILQDLDYADRIFHTAKTMSYTLWGIQTSIDSLIQKDGSPNIRAIELTAAPGLYYRKRPLLWIGTDTFLPARGRRLGKRIPPEKQLRSLLAELDKRGIEQYHYWICSDGESGWDELAAETIMIAEIHQEYENFALLAHSPFLVPYSAAPAAFQFSRDDRLRARIRYRYILKGGDPTFDFSIPARIETPYEQMNRLLENEKPPGQDGFLDLIKKKDFFGALSVLYYFLKQDRFFFESLGHQQEVEKLRIAEEMVEGYLSKHV